MIVNSSGWDTDCDSGNVGRLLGIKNGLAGIDALPTGEGPWRTGCTYPPPTLAVLSPTL